MLELVVLLAVFAFLQSGRIRLERRVDSLERQVVALGDALRVARADHAPAAEAIPETVALPEGTPAPADIASNTALAAPSTGQDGAAAPTLSPVTTASPVPTPSPAVIPAAASTPASPRKGLSLESLLGGHWAVWVGGVALALGGVLMARYAIESGLLSPAVRLMVAAGFGLLLVAGGEIVRRKALPAASRLLASTRHTALVPGILTAAGGVTLFASIYAAHQLYGFIGPASTFVALAAVAFLLLGLSLLHGQALAGLGLLGAIAAPALVQSETPDIPVLMTYIFVVWLGSMLASRFRDWTLVPILATLGAGGWAVISADFMPLSHAPILFFLLASLLLNLVAADAPLFPASGGPDGVEAQRRRTAAAEALSAVLALTGMAVATIHALHSASSLDPGQPYGFLLVTAALLLAFAFRRGAVIATILTGLAATAGLGAYLLASISPFYGPESALADAGTWTAFILGLIAFSAAAIAFAAGRQTGRLRERLFAALAAMPVLFVAMSYADHGDALRDPVHALLAAFFALGLLLGVEAINRLRPTGIDQRSEDGLVTAAFAAVAFSLFTVATALSLTLLWPLAGLGFLLAARFKPWRALPWMPVIAALPLALLIAFDPTIVGPLHLGTTPLFNALLPAYGGPALLFALAAWQSRKLGGGDAKVTRALDALALLFAFIAIAVLVRHGMNHGRLGGGTPSLGEQSIYTLLLIGFSGAMTLFDRRNANPVFVYGSMAASAASIGLVLLAHLDTLNPYLSGELVGNWPLLNLLLPAYLLPAIAYCGLAILSRQSRPAPYRTALSASGGVLAFAWLTLSVRQLWQGTSLAGWQGFLEGETYSYSVAWLLSGVALLALGARFNSIGLRYASAAVVILTVVKVFLFDLSNLEGLLRALSFIGLGFVLIGIGLFYQRLLARAPAEVPVENQHTPPSA